MWYTFNWREKKMNQIQVLKITNKDASDVWSINQFEGAHGAILNVPISSCLWRKNTSYHSLESAQNTLKRHISLDEDVYYLASHNGRVTATIQREKFAVVLEVKHYWKETFSFKNTRAALNHFLNGYTLKNGI